MNYKIKVAVNWFETKHCNKTILGSRKRDLRWRFVKVFAVKESRSVEQKENLFQLISSTLNRIKAFLL